jgi:hypothetical protein
MTQTAPRTRALLCAAILCLFQLTAAAQDHAAKIQEVLSLAHKYRQFHGTALVAENGKVIYKGAFGMANMEWNTPTQLTRSFASAPLPNSLRQCWRSSSSTKASSNSMEKSQITCRLSQRRRRESHCSSPAYAHIRNSELYESTRLLRERQPQSLQRHGLR